MKNFILGIFTALYFVLGVFETYKYEIIDDYYLNLLSHEYYSVYNITTKGIIIITSFLFVVKFSEVLEKIFKNH